MAIQPIRLLGDAVLWQSCKPVQNVQTPEIFRITEDLRDTLEDFRAQKGFGRGIAAPQIGVSLRIIYINMKFDTEQGDRSPFCGVMMNPEIIEQSATTFELWDDCFSFPDLLVKVQRHREITVRYLQADGTQQTIEAHGSFSELLQHEIDHLNGILSIDRAINSHAFALRQAFSL